MRRLAGTLLLLVAASLLTGPGSAAAQVGTESPVHWSALPLAAPAAPGAAVELHVQATIDGNWHLYSATQPPGGPKATRFSIARGPVELAGAVRQSRPETELDPNFGIQTEFFTGAADFYLP